MAPPSTPAAEAAAAFHYGCAARGSADYFDWQERLAGVRRSVATLLGAGEEEVALTGNTSEGLAMVAEAFPWRPGDAVLVPVPDFPANVYPWMHLERKGVKIRFVRRRQGRLTADDFARALVPEARMAVASTVDFASGYATDLEALGSFCREKGLIFGVDAIQSLGVLALDVKKCGINFLAAGGHKWLLGPMGTGMLYVDAALTPDLDPPLVGWKSVADEENFELHFELKENAQKFEPGTMNLAGIFGLGASLELLREVGPEAVRDRIFALCDRFAEGLLGRGLELASPLSAGERSGILSFRPQDEAAATFRHLMANRVQVSLRGGLIRLAPHFYNNEDDVEGFFRVLDKTPR
ncbi:MAG: cysteine desulfurase [Desulfuromonas sp.]|nr:MAG: cysteine desulfurase [Desulfuromonas sp.]